MAHFFRRAMVEQRMGAQADWNAVDSLMQKALAAAEKVARYRHAQLSAVRLAGDINAGNNDVTLDELLATIKSEMVKLGPHIGLDPNQLLLGAENRSPVTVKRTGGEFAAAPSVAEHGCLVGVELTALCRALGGRWRGFGALARRGDGRDREGQSRP